MQAIRMGWIHKQGNLEGLSSFPHEIPNRVMNMKILKYEENWGEEPASETVTQVLETSHQVSGMSPLIKTWSSWEHYTALGSISGPKFVC